MDKIYRGVRVGENKEEKSMVREGVYRGVKSSGKTENSKMKSGSYRGVKWNETSTTNSEE